MLKIKMYNVGKFNANWQWEKPYLFIFGAEGG